MIALSCREIHCLRENWNAGGEARLDGISAEFESGKLYGFHGPEGCGKELLLHVLGLLEPSDGGRLSVLGEPVEAWPENDRRRVCNEIFGFLFDHPCLIPTFSVAENVAIPLFRICGADAREARVRTMAVLELTGIAHLETALASRLEPAVQHRAALARALVHAPRILMAFSPRAEAELIELAAHCAASLDLCVLWAGEVEDLRPHASRLIAMREGRIVRETPP